MRACWVASMLGVACGDGSSGTPAPPASEELPPGTVDIDPSQAPDTSGASVELEEIEPAPMDEPPDERYRGFLDALARSIQARCDCQFAELGHPSAEVCFERLRKPDFAEVCELRAFAQNSDELGERYACLGRLRDASVDCIAAQGCGALEACEAERTAARSMCGGVVYADTEFGDFVDACERFDRFGTGSDAACPDATVESMPVGQMVFEGDTTGAGDDVTLSCHWDFEGFESPEVVVEWRAPEAGTYTFSTENSAFTTQLGVLDGCGGAELACASSDGTVFGGAALALPLAADQTVFIVLEGYSAGDSGYVRLNVSAGP